MKACWWLLLLTASVWATTRVAAQDADHSHYVSPWKTPWDYEGPRGAQHWSELDPAYSVCNRGSEQSPIDIRHPQKAKLPALRFEYATEAVNYVINNAHTVRVNYHDPAGLGSYLIVGGKRFQLTQFHFHRPSEEYVNGKAYDMVLHLMHQGTDGAIVGVAVFLKAGASNPVIQQIWDHMPAHEGQRAVPGLKLNPGALLPTDRAYYSYRGSQTAPPCTEGVRWYVLKAPVEISRQQIAAFAALYPHDVRPPQPLNGRTVLESDWPRARSARAR
jgi:carbonic anhydrase